MITCSRNLPGEPVCGRPAVTVLLMQPRPSALWPDALWTAVGRCTEHPAAADVDLMRAVGFGGQTVILPVQVAAL